MLLDGLVQNSGISSALALEILQACTEPLISCALSKLLTHLPLVSHICVNELSQHWFK